MFAPSASSAGWSSSRSAARTGAQWGLIIQDERKRVLPVLPFPHLLIVMGKPGEIMGGALAARLPRLWQIIVQNVGDDLRLDPHQVYEQTWNDLLQRYSTEADLTIEGEGWTSIYVREPDRMEAVAERFIFPDEL
jgi:hypothetical protein